VADTAVAAFLRRAAEHPHRVALRELAAGGAPRDAALTWGEWAAESRRFAAALVDAGVRAGDAVAILAPNTFAWPVAEMGTLMGGAVSVGLYPTSPPPQLRTVLADCGAAVAVAGSAEHLRALAEAAAAAPALRTIVCTADVPADAVAAGRDGHGGAASVSVVAAAEWARTGDAALARAELAAELDRRTDALRPEDTAALIYTSGSTGEPKGAVLPHRYLVASAASIRGTLGFASGDSSLSFLPFCHAAERVFGLHTRVACGMEAGLVRDGGRVWEAAQAFGPTVFGGLPRFFEKAVEALRAEHRATGGEMRERWDRTVELGLARLHHREAGRPAPPALEAEWREAGVPVFARARAFFGGRMRVATSGGAPLPRDAAAYLAALDVPVLGGYGLSEHLCVAFNRADDFSLDAVGPPMAGTELRVADDGEILVRRGPLTFAGYHGRPRETGEAFTADGAWLRTGDVGAVDGRGMLRLTGRKKELIVLSGGKKVAPLPIEARLAGHPWIARAVLHGEGRRFVTALVCLRRAEVEAWAAARGIGGDWAALLRRPEVHAAVQGAVDGVNAALSRPEQVRRFALLERDLLAEEDELTPTLKVRRAVVAEKHRHALDALYR
jgi:long-chain acyl-CoA synthetase